ncbi:MAG TPA: response regulator transcription factor [Vicinamibacterales bacterium]
MQALIADDDRIAREILARSLRQWGFEVVAAADGGKAWSYLETVSGPTLAIVDWMMPELDGPSICSRMRAERPTANVYLVLLTSLESRSDIVAGLNAGADDYIVKPFDPEELRARVNVGVRILTLQERLSQRVAELQQALNNVKTLHGLLPICSYCKRIRGDDQYWQQVEKYIGDHSEAQFSHGICPSCYEEVEKEIERTRAARSSSSLLPE